MNFFKYAPFPAIVCHPIRLVCSMVLFLCALFLFASVISFSCNDPSWFVLSTEHGTVYNFCGPIGAYVAGLSVYLFGLHALMLSVSVLLLSFFLFMRTIWYAQSRLAGSVILLFSGPVIGNMLRYDAFSPVVPGGLVGYYGVFLGTQSVPPTVLLIFASTVWIFGWILLLHIRVMRIMRAIPQMIINLWRITRAKAYVENAGDAGEYVGDMQRYVDAVEPQKIDNDGLYRDNERVRYEYDGAASRVDTSMQEADTASKKDPYRLPNATIFNRKKTTGDRYGIPHRFQKVAETLEHKLERFGVKGRVSSIKRGPVVTLFEYEPHVDSKLSKIIALEDDLALALQALSIRIIAPIPGRSVVGFEVANDTRSEVLFSDIIHSNAYQEQAFLLPLVLGVDTIGDEVLVDLARMPHLLVAGSTGSGKSVGLNTMLVSLLCSLRPDELQLILIDPKRLEFAPYADIPHLLFPIVTNPQYASPLLRWVVAEMERRYTMMAASGVRNNVDYQKKIRGKMHAEPMPFIVVVIDEFADLMMTAGKEIEGLIARIAQMARAAGIHMIVATQRPSVDVITGLIKANFPSRIAFRVSSRVDSRTILDTMGAHKLLGRGDMLFINSSDSSLQRVHGAYVSDAEIEKLMCHVKAQGAPEYLDIATVCPTGQVDRGDGDDALYADIKQYVQEIDEVSISSIQRTFRIGYNRSARIIERLESEGLILPAQGGKMRKVVR